VLQRTLRLADDTDHAGIDLDKLLDQFRKASPDWWTPNTISTYCSNVRRVLTGFNNDGEWVGTRRTPTPRHPTDLGCSIELRPGRSVHLRLPADLTAAEAGRVARFITALPAMADPANATEHDSGPAPVGGADGGRLRVADS
jgi:hypothetical protein